MALVLRRCAPQLPPLFVIWDYNRGAAIYRDELSGPVQPASQPGPMLISPCVGTAWARSALPQHPGRLQAPPTKRGVLKPASTRPRADPGQLKPRGEGFVPARQSSAPPRCLLAPPTAGCVRPRSRGRQSGGFAPEDAEQGFACLCGGPKDTTFALASKTAAQDGKLVAPSLPGAALLLPSMMCGVAGQPRQVGRVSV